MMLSASTSAAAPFSKPFTLSSADGKLWIAPLTDATARTPLIIKGANWMGFQKDGCPSELWKHSLDDYIAFLTVHRFNAVRLPLSADIRLRRPQTGRASEGSTSE